MTQDFDSWIAGSIPTTPVVLNSSKFKEGVIILDYAIKNNNNVYIKLGENGSPVTCVESIKGRFEYSKAVNILNNLPKKMKKFNFRVEAIPEIKTKEEKESEKKIIQNDNYVLSESIIRWVDKFGICSDILEEAKQREDELIQELYQVDQEFIDILHIIEIEKSKDLYGGWQEYKRIRENRERRRTIKDELLIVENILKEINPSCLQRERVQKAIDGLLNRKYTFRVIETDENVT